MSMNISREYAKFKRLFVGPKLTRKQRIALMPPMPANKGDISIFFVAQPVTNVELTDDDLAVIQKRAAWSAYIVERRKKRDKSMPPWANAAAINAIYFEARCRTAATGVKYEVDHIIPSNHPLVCGLHVETNLQVITEFENMSKSNKFDLI
jgi:hypothetical protein